LGLPFGGRALACIEQAVEPGDVVFSADMGGEISEEYSSSRLKSYWRQARTSNSRARPVSPVANSERAIAMAPVALAGGWDRNQPSLAASLKSDVAASGNVRSAARCSLSRLGQSGRCCRKVAARENGVLLLRWVSRTHSKTAAPSGSTPAGAAVAFGVDLPDRTWSIARCSAFSAFDKPRESPGR
jgi:hypothetical protein